MCTVIVSISNLTNIYKCTFRYKNYILKNTGTSTNCFRENMYKTIILLLLLNSIFSTFYLPPANYWVGRYNKLH